MDKLTEEAKKIMSKEESSLFLEDLGYTLRKDGTDIRVPELKNRTLGELPAMERANIEEAIKKELDDLADSIPGDTPAEESQDDDEADFIPD